MPTGLETFGINTATSAAQGLLGLGIGMATANWQDRRQLSQQEKLIAMQEAANRRQADYTQTLNKEMWDYANYENQVKHIENAGLNPALLYGGGGGGGTTANGGQAAGVSGGQAPVGGGEIGMGIQQAMQLSLLNAQKEVLQSQARKNNVEAENQEEGGANRENTKADTENKVLQQLVTKYTGKELQSQYEEVNQPNRKVAAETMYKELSARQGVAGTLYDMWVNGKLADKSNAEVEQILLDNAKTRAEKAEIYKRIDLLDQNIKGAKLDNIIKDLDAGS